MAAAELQLIISTVDKATAGLNKISGGLEKTGKAALGVGKVVGGLAFGGAIAGVGALSAALVTGIGDARDAAKVFAQTQAVIKSTGGAAGFTADQIADMAGELSAASGKSLFGDDDIQRGQNMLLTFTNIKETLPAATQTMLDMATAMGTDAEAGAIALGKALNDPKEGISALSRVGVTFTEQQKEQIKTMQAAGDMAGAQTVILNELNKEFGGSAAAAAAADGGWAQFTDRMGELAESVGGQVLPALNGILAWLNSPEVQEGITAFVDGVVDGFTGIYNAVQLLITGDFTGGIFGLSEDHPVIQALINIHNLVSDVAHAFDTWSGFSFELGIVAALQAIGDKFPALQPLTDWLQNIAPPLIQGVREAWGLARDSLITFIDALKGDWQGDPEKVHPITQAIGEFGKMIHDQGIPAIEGFIGWLKVQIPIATATFKKSIDDDVIGMIKRMDEIFGEHTANEKKDLDESAMNWQTFNIGFQRITGEMQRAFFDFGASSRRGWIAMKEDGQAWLLSQSTMLTVWAETWRQKISDVVTEVKTLPGKIASAVGNLGTTLYQAGVDLILGMINGVRAQAAALGAAAAKVVTDAVAAAKAAVGIKSPSTKTRDEIGKPMGEGIVDGIEDTADTLKETIGKTVLGALQVDKLTPTAKAAGTKVAESYKAGASEGLDATESLKQIFGGKLRAAIEVDEDQVKQIFGGKLRAALEPEMDETGEHLARVLIAGFNRIMADFDFGKVPDMVFVPGSPATPPPPSPKGPKQDRGAQSMSSYGYIASPGGAAQTTVNFYAGAIVQLPGEDARLLAGRVADEIDRRNRLARTR